MIIITTIVVIGTLLGLLFCCAVGGDTEASHLLALETAAIER